MKVFETSPFTGQVSPPFPMAHLFLQVYKSEVMYTETVKVKWDVYGKEFC